MCIRFRCYCICIYMCVMLSVYVCVCMCGVWPSFILGWKWEIECQSFEQKFFFFLFVFLLYSVTVKHVYHHTANTIHPAGPLISIPLWHKKNVRITTVNIIYSAKENSIHHTHTHIKKRKQSMWSATPAGSFTFRLFSFFLELRYYSLHVCVLPNDLLILVQLLHTYLVLPLECEVIFMTLCNSILYRDYYCATYMKT